MQALFCCQCKPCKYFAQQEFLNGFKKIFWMLSLFATESIFSANATSEHIPIYYFIYRFQYDNYELRTGKRLKVNVSVANLRLFVGNIPKSKSREEIFDEFGKLTGLKITESNKVARFDYSTLLCWLLHIYI